MTQQQQHLTLCGQDSSGVVAGSTGSASICGKDFRERTLRSLKLSLGKLWRRRSVTITEYDPTYKVAYLGNVLTGWAKGEGCVEKPLSTLWKNYTGSSKPDVQMKVTITQAGLKAVTKEHGLTEYWSHRITYCAAPASFPRIFCWVYRHEGRKLKQELRCHAVLCSKEAVARRMASQLKTKLAQSLSEFKRDKVCRQNARLSLANSVYDNPSLPRRKILLSTGSHNYRPPLERSKSAPKLMVIEECLEEGEEEFAEHARNHSTTLHRNSMLLNRLDEAAGEDKLEEYSRTAEETEKFYHDDETRPRETFRLLKNGDVINRDKCDQPNGEARLIPCDSEAGNRKANGSVINKLVGPEEGKASEKTGRVLRFKMPGDEMNKRVDSKFELRGSREDKVCWNRNVTNHQTERLLVIGSCKEGDIRRRISSVDKEHMTHQDCESDEGSNSLQSVSSTASSSSEASSLLLENVAPCLKMTKPLTPYVYEDTDIQTPEDEVEVDLHPTGGPVKRRHPVSVEVDRLSAQLRRSATFPPPSHLGCVTGGEVSELDSLSEEDDAMETPGEHEDVPEEEDEDNVSDESGYAELMDVGVKEAGEGLISANKQQKNIPRHQLMKTILRGNSRNSQCLQV